VPAVQCPCEDLLHACTEAAYITRILFPRFLPDFLDIFRGFLSRSICQHSAGHQNGSQSRRIVYCPLGCARELQLGKWRAREIPGELHRDSLQRESDVLRIYDLRLAGTQSLGYLGYLADISHPSDTPYLRDVLANCQTADGSRKLRKSRCVSRVHSAR